MFWLKGCPRCHGDLYEERDHYGVYLTCAQCGFTKDLFTKLVDPREARPEPVAVAAAPQQEDGKRHRRSNGGRHAAKTLARSAVAARRVA